MKVVIRVDASLKIGTGHVMRCLTLANALKVQGKDVSFICRAHVGHLMDWIQQKGFKVYGLPIESTTFLSEDRTTLYHDWLGVSSLRDSQVCRPILKKIEPTWLIVDHYAIDECWEKSLQDTYQYLMVLDDLANRKHVCDLLLDQTYGRKSEDYIAWIPKGCLLLLGSQYALLRPEFSQWRTQSLERRNRPVLKKILITLGGVDSHNVTLQLLNALAKLTGKSCTQNYLLRHVFETTVVMGVNAPHLNSVVARAQTMPNKTSIKVGVTNMAELMTDADLVIASAGATIWEVACLGVPLVLLKLADNQDTIIKKLLETQAVWLWNVKQLEQAVTALDFFPPPLLHRSSNTLSAISDGQGSQRVLDGLIQVETLL